MFQFFRIQYSTVLLTLIIYEKDRALGNWVKKQRQMNNLGTLNKEREAKLYKIGFVWSVRGNSWENFYKQLKAYLEILTLNTTNFSCLFILKG